MKLQLLFNNLIISLLRSFGQVMLQKSAVTGSLFIIGIGLNSPIMLLGGVVATLSGLATAKLLKYEEAEIHNGLYGFNAALVGIAIFFFLTPSVLAIGLLLVGGAVSTVFRHLISKFIPTRSYTAPFVVTTWLFLAFVEVIGLNDLIIPSEATDVGYLYSVARGLGQVLFQDYWITGIVFLFGIFFYSRIAAIWAVIGSGLGTSIAYTFNFPEASLSMGIYGFNATLVAIALADQYGKKSWPVFLGIVLSVVITRGFEFAPLPSLTAPFVLASWLLLGFVKINTNDVQVK